MKAVGLFLLLAPPVLQFAITDGRGKETSAVTIDAGAPDDDGWRSLRVGKAKGAPVLVWPFDASAKAPDWSGTHSRNCDSARRRKGTRE